MFYFLHRLVKWVFIALIAAGLYWAWLQREALEPVYVWYDVYENGGLQKADRLEVVQGKVTHVLDGHTFQMTEGNKVYSVRLAGFEVPPAPVPPEDQPMELERRRFLRENILKQQTTVDVAYAGGGSVLGVATVNGTNLNLYYLTNGLGKFRPGYIKALPRDMQYQFFAAQRMHEKHLEQRTALAMQAGAP